MNNTEINELNQMREQLATLKKQLDTQEIINDRLIKEAMGRNLSALNNGAIWICVVCLVMIPAGYFNFRNLGLSEAFCIATSLLFVICLAAVIISHYRIHKRDILSGNLVAVYKEVARMKRIYKSWHYWSIPMLLLWFGWLEYEIYITLANGDLYALLGVSASGIFGGIIGGIIGLRLHKRALRTADDLLCQIEELQWQE